MTLLRSYPSRDVLDRPSSRAVDIVVFLAAAVLLGVIARVSSGMNVPFDGHRHRRRCPRTRRSCPTTLPGRC